MLDAVWIALLGMAIVFFTLAVVLGVMIGLNKVSKPSEEDEGKDS